MSRATQGVSNREFVRILRSQVEEYLRAVDEWETTYRKFYRVRGSDKAVSPDMVEPDRRYREARKKLEKLIPEARRLSYRYAVRDVWPGFMRSSLGRYAPQTRTVSAISRSERAAVTESLARLAAACEEEERSQEWKREEPEHGWLQRVFGRFFG